MPGGLQSAATKKPLFVDSRSEAKRAAALPN
jgi:hypothetical protein